MIKIKVFDRLFRIKPKYFCWGISVLIAGIVSWESRNLLRSGTETAKQSRVLIAARDLESGHVISINDFVFELRDTNEVQFGQVNRFITDQELDLIEGKMLRRELKKGEALTSQLIASAMGRQPRVSIPEGHRAYFLETLSNEMVFPSARVDLILKPEMDNRESLILAENVLVLSVGHAMENRGVGLALRPEEIEYIEKNLRFGTVALALRNPNEKLLRGALKKGKRGSQKRVKVEIITEGE